MKHKKSINEAVKQVKASKEYKDLEKSLNASKSNKKYDAEVKKINAFYDKKLAALKEEKPKKIGKEDTINVYYGANQAGDLSNFTPRSLCMGWTYLG